MVKMVSICPWFVHGWCGVAYYWPYTIFIKSYFIPCKAESFITFEFVWTVEKCEVQT
uniref:Uncharacterized protein n=1 Tax=Ciona intestinalis TaxID=7719 RepID=H2XMS4_CIOIN